MFDQPSPAQCTVLVEWGQKWGQMANFKKLRANNTQFS